jgi:hypothetical protein
LASSRHLEWMASWLRITRKEHGQGSAYNSSGAPSRELAMAAFAPGALGSGKRERASGRGSGVKELGVRTAWDDGLPLVEHPRRMEQGCEAWWPRVPARAARRIGGMHCCWHLGRHFGASYGQTGPWALNQNCFLYDALRILLWGHGH